MNSENSDTTVNENIPDDDILLKAAAALKPKKDKLVTDMAYFSEMVNIIKSRPSQIMLRPHQVLRYLNGFLYGLTRVPSENMDITSN
ncbi:hypothetical protein CDAR_601891 [Caerostris darwini]|uniref:Uncharacterized protein n=1 Tax=Caerostris darwini TaxID=1538125 RepID=A0AAV4UQA2_9ARAC|nr:hypothetical protein CDAR_601891 [Caerostris darwini]